MTNDEVMRNLTYHPLTPDEQSCCEELSKAARVFATAICLFTPPCAEQTLAIRAIEEARMRANQAIAINSDHAKGGE